MIPKLSYQKMLNIDGSLSYQLNPVYEDEWYGICFVESKFYAKGIRLLM